METLYLIIIGMLFALAVFDLIVGVGNDAVNFLNAAVGSRAFSFKVLLVFASLGVFFGAAFSNGMMEVARHGIFQPQHYYFAEIMTILVAVMLTDVILLDVFNTFGLPTSTTVSLVFEMLGASVAISCVKMATNSPDLGFGDLINTSKALEVILGIFVSVAIAFTVGAIIQAIARAMFSFGYKKNMKYFIGIFGGFSLTSIVYFILVKGLKTASFMSKDFQNALHQNELLVIGGLFVVFFLISHLLHAVGVNMLKVIIAFGTFALALAFAGNDLMNFVGVPLTGLSSFQHLTAEAGDPNTYKMAALLEKETGQWFLLMLAGVIMVLTILLSKKAHRVIQTSVTLSSQGATEEIFGSNPVARALVRVCYGIFKKIQSITPEGLRNWLARRFDSEDLILEKDDAAFDLIRAAVTLMLASCLIAFGTSLKLPLSTTYVTFMVAMGTSLADRAWGRESAVYRITGVLSVIGGWFLTAFFAFSGCFIVAIALHFGGFPAKFLLFAIVIILLIRSNVRFKKAMAARKKEKDKFAEILNASPDTNIFPLVQDFSKNEWNIVIGLGRECYGESVEGLVSGDLGRLKTCNKRVKMLKRYVDLLRRQGTICTRKIKDEDVIAKNFFLYQANDFLGDSIFDLEQIFIPCLQHIDNNFEDVPADKGSRLHEFSQAITQLLDRCAVMVKKADYSDYDSMLLEAQSVSDKIATERKKHMLLNDPKQNTRVEILYLTVLYESRSYLKDIVNLTKASRKFLTEELKKGKKEDEDGEPSLEPVV